VKGLDKGKKTAIREVNQHGNGSKIDHKRIRMKRDFKEHFDHFQYQGGGEEGKSSPPVSDKKRKRETLGTEGIDMPVGEKRDDKNSRDKVPRGKGHRVNGRNRKEQNLCGPRTSWGEKKKDTKRHSKKEGLSSGGQAAFMEGDKRPPSSYC